MGIVATTSATRYGFTETYGQPETDGGAIAALVFAIAAPLLPIWGWIAVLILAAQAEKRIRRAPDTLRGREIVTAARIILWVWFVLFLITAIVVAAVLVWVKYRNR